MVFVFDIRKAIAATAFLCKINGGQLNVLHLIKMLYVADRTALLSWHRTITGDKFVSMKHGPVLSKIYDLMCGRSASSRMVTWNSVFNPRIGNKISIKHMDVDLGPLAKREIELLNEAYKKFKDVPAGKLVDFLHKVLPEWKDPGESSAAIDPEDILLHAGLTHETVAEIRQELELVQSAKLALQAA